jgi:predicted alpha/beta hydrolase
MPHSSVSDVRSSDFGYHHSLALDIPAALEAMPGPPAVIAGHSLGGQLALLYAASHPEHTTPVVAIASGSSYHGTVATQRGQRVRRRQAATVSLITRALGYFPGNRLGFGGRQPRAVMQDWSLEARTGRYDLVGSSFDYEAALARLDAAVLMITLEGDTLITDAAAKYLGNRLETAKLSSVRLTLDKNEGAPFNHFRWARQNPTAVLEAIDDWLPTIEFRSRD